MEIVILHGILEPQIHHGIQDLIKIVEAAL